MAELTRAQLLALASGTNIPDNIVGAVDPVDVRNQIEEERDSTINKLDDGIEVTDVGGRNALKYSNPQTLAESDKDALISKEMAESISNGLVVITPSTPYTAINKDVVLWDCTTGDKVLNLPQSSLSTNYKVNIKKIDSSINTITVNGNASETIDGGLTAVIKTQYESITVVCDGLNWFII